MKVRIRRPVNWIGPYQIADLLKYVGVSEDKCFAIGEKLSETRLKDVCEWVHAKRQRKDKIVIEPHDTWSMDNTLAPIILPMLEQLKETKHGAPWVDPEDTPEHLRPTDEEIKKYHECGDIDSKHFDRWDSVLDQMIFSFRALTTDWESQFFSGTPDLTSTPVDKDLNPVSKEDAEYFLTDVGKNSTFKFDKEGYTLYAERIDKGLKLFGKYYRNLWD